jgi:thiamine kinase
MRPSGSTASLESIAQAYVPGVGRLTMERLGTGLVNVTYRVMRDGCCYSLRVPAPHGAGLGLDRAWECRVLERAGAAGVAPPIERCEPSAGILVARWVEGATLSPPEVREASHLGAVAALIRRVHALPIPARPRRMSPADWVTYYRAAQGDGGGRSASAALNAALTTRLAALAALPEVPTALCHSDLHVANLKAALNGLILLDWEYAHVADPFWDLAGWSCNNDLETGACVDLLASYLGRDPERAELIRLDHLTWLYDYVCLLWSELYTARAGTQGEEVLARAKLLARRLQSSSVVVETGNLRHTSFLCRANGEG